MGPMQQRSRRQTIGFTEAELGQIGELMGRQARALEGVNTVSAAIRRLTTVGLKQVIAEDLADRYRIAAADAEAFATPARMASANRAAGMARQRMGVSSRRTVARGL
jgi:hypothetical protein